MAVLVVIYGPKSPFSSVFRRQTQAIVTGPKNGRHRHVDLCIAQNEQEVSDSGAGLITKKHGAATGPNYVSLNAR